MGEVMFHLSCGHPASGSGDAVRIKLNIASHRAQTLLKKAGAFI